MLAFSNDYYGMIFRATQSVELFCAYYKTTNERLYRVVAYAAKLSLPIYLFQGVSAYLIMILNERGIQNHIITTGVFWLSLLFISNTSLWFVNKWKRSLK